MDEKKNLTEKLIKSLEDNEQLAKELKISINMVKAIWFMSILIGVLTVIMTLKIMKLI